MITKLCLVLWVLPNDTLNVVINRKKEGKLSDKITFKGTASKISEYLSKTKFYYYDIKPNKEELPRDYNSRIDSLTLVALNKFNDFKRNNKLPGWFVEYEKIDIFLFSESLKQSQYNQRYWMYKQAVKTKATETQTINRIINEYKINQYNKYLSRKMLVMGEKAPGFYLEDINGAKVSLSDFKGKLICLNFWGTYCAPCIKSIPKKNELVQKYSSNNFVLVNICLDNNSFLWKDESSLKRVKKYNLKIRIYP